jgi:hypothetical protein
MGLARWDEQGDARSETQCRRALETNSVVRRGGTPHMTSWGSLGAIGGKGAKHSHTGEERRHDSGAMLCRMYCGREGDYAEGQRLGAAAKGGQEAGKTALE